VVAESKVSHRGGRTDAPGDTLLVWLLIVLIVGVPSIFYRKLFFTFQMPQLTLFWLVATVVILVGAYRVVLTGAIDRGPGSLALASVAFAAALSMSTVLSPQPWAALTGLTARGAGALSYGFCLLILHSVYGLVRRRRPEPLVLAMISASLIVAGYTLLQAYGMDPVDWAGDEAYVGSLVFSTLGNANFSSGFLGLMMPLVVWVPFGSSCSGNWKIVGGAAVGASALALVHLNSFQGNVAAGSSVLVLVLWVLSRDNRDRVVATLVVVPVAATLVASAVVQSTTGVVTLFVFTVVPATCAVVAIKWDERDGDPSPDSSGSNASDRLWVWFAACVIGIGVLVLVFGRRLLDEAMSGLDQRVEYWKVSLSVFESSPLVGTGLETYRNYFTTHRSVEQAVEWETLLSNTPHSVPLSILSGGGVFLFVTYLAVLAVIGYYGVSAVVRSNGYERMFYGAVMASWIAYQIQALVSTDMPALIFIQWVLGGILVAGGAPNSAGSRDLPWRAVRTRGGRVVTSRQRFAATGLAAVFIVCVVPLTAPFRANSAAFRGQQAMNRGDLNAARAELTHAVELQPRDGFYAERLAVVYEGGGLDGLAFEERQKIARLQPGDPYAAVRAARAAIRLNQLDVAEQWYERAVPNDPYGSTVLTEAADFFAKTGSGDRALELLASFEALDSTNLGAWQVAGEVHAFLGNEEAARHADVCGVPGQVGCWATGGQ